jgi:glycosyltransferase involved in cell wall biosynthesis
MNIGFDAKRYFHNSSGLGNYSRDLVSGLLNQFPEDTYYLFDNEPNATNLDSRLKLVSPKIKSVFWRVFGIKNDIKNRDINIYHGLSNELPFGNWNSKVKKLVTVHDVIFKSHKNQYKFIDRRIYDLKTKHALNIADKVIATSKSTKAQILKYYSVAEDKIEVVYQSCGSAHWDTYNNQEISDFKSKYNLSGKILLYVSSFNTRKNHLQLLKAYNSIKVKDFQLVLAGIIGNTYKDCIDYIKANKLNENVMIFTDLKNKELPLLYRSADAFIYPSLNEGFGIPLLEALCANLPIVV